jgi:hypothetical protein
MAPGMLMKSKIGLVGYINITVGNLALSAQYTQRENIPACLKKHTQKCDEYVRNHTGRENYYLPTHHEDSSPAAAQRIRW